MSAHGTTVEARLREEVATWASIGHPALLQRFILGTGQAWQPAPLPRRIRKGAKRACFEQAAALAAKHRATLRYVEGYGLSAGLAGFPMPIHHAWCADAAGRVVDPTWDDPAGSLYFGRAFTFEEWDRETDVTGTLSALDGAGLNAAFMFRLMPELRAACDEARKARPDFAALRAAAAVVPVKPKE